MKHPFKEPPDLGVYVCHHVSRQNLPVLHVVRDGDGDWQFLCGADHSGDSDADVLCLEHVVARDPSLGELAGLGCGHSAARDEVGGAWDVVDESEQRIRDNIERVGWHIVGIAADEEGPGFAFSIGMETTLGHPELIVFGLPMNLMMSMINELGARVRAGEVVEPGVPVEGLIDEATCILHEVDRRHYREYVGYARWYHDGDDFRVWQCFWPGKVDGLFPWEDGAADIVKERQPDLRARPAG